MKNLNHSLTHRVQAILGTMFFEHDPDVANIECVDTAMYFSSVEDAEETCEIMISRGIFDSYVIPSVYKGEIRLHPDDEADYSPDTPPDTSVEGVILPDGTHFIQLDLPIYWASALVNGDTSGLEDVDLALVDAFHESMKRSYESYWCTDVTDLIGIKQPDWLPHDVEWTEAECATYTFQVKDQPCGYCGSQQPAIQGESGWDECPDCGGI